MVPGGAPRLAGGSRLLALWKLWAATPSWWRLLLHEMRAAASRTFWTAGTSRPMRMAMIAITTSSSISVKPRRERVAVMVSSRTIAGGDNRGDGELRDPSALRPTAGVAAASRRRPPFSDAEALPALRAPRRGTLEAGTRGQASKIARKPGREVGSDP